ncbi:hypothetical protein QJS04_geneDACA014764 [Acorus gramineus]|uniref:Uncharacterized protein n=1 Tax=Acorus gramineus TaxID=55184 RepID=A0AAV9BNP1_ACOGR|nr:hypothetical protein QJS04_geneDACA014764 [Acorus gramineus]
MKYTGKKSEETKASGNASPNSRRKRKKSSMTPDNSDPNGKLRQPTILDALKRAGVHVSQEVANEGSSGPPSSGKKLQSEEHKLPDSNMLEPAELSGAAKIVDAQRFKFRPLLPHCFNILSFAENQDSCCSDPAAEDLMRAKSIGIPACSVSFLLASEVLVTLESLVNSVSGFVDKSLEGNGKNVHVEFSQGVLPFLRKKLGNTAHKLESTSDILDELACSILPQHEENLAILNKLVKKAILLRSRSDVQSVNGVLANLRKSVNVVVSLVNMCKTHEKVTLHAMSVKYGGKFVDSFLKVFDFLQAHFQAHNDAILQLVRELQKATRIIQTLCSEAKNWLGFLVSDLLSPTTVAGNLKHKDLMGQVVSSQVYNNDDEDSNNQGDADQEDPTGSHNLGVNDAD